MKPAPFVHSVLAMTRRLKRRDQCPARLAFGCPEVPKADVLGATAKVRCRRDCVAKLENAASAKFSRERAHRKFRLETPS
jgi:hypothetical protein